MSGYALVNQAYLMYGKRSCETMKVVSCALNDSVVYSHGFLLVSEQERDQDALLLSWMWNVEFIMTDFNLPDSRMDKSHTIRIRLARSCCQCLLRSCHTSVRAHNVPYEI